MAAGTLTGATTVASGATLAGSGTINCALTFASGSNFASVVAPTIADHINVVGTASLAGTAQVTPINGSGAVGTSYALLTATSISGEFSALSINGAFANWISPTLHYSGNEVDLILAPKTIASQLQGPV